MCPLPRRWHPKTAIGCSLYPEAAAKLGMASSTLYKTADDYPFTVRQGRRLKFSSRGIDKWIQLGTAG